MAPVSGSHCRFSDSRNGLFEIEANTLLGYSLTPKMTFWAGYPHHPQCEGGQFTVMEHRGRQQVTFDNLLKIAGGTINVRMRVEERWREHVPCTA